VWVFGRRRLAIAARTGAVRVVVRIIRLWRAGRRSIAEGIRLLPAEVRGNVPREGRSRLHRRPAPSARQALRAWVAEGIRLLPGFREHAALSQPRVGAGCTGDPRRQARQPGTAGAAGPAGLGRRRDSAPTGVPGARRAFPTAGRSRLHRRSAPPGAATRHRWRGRPCRAWVAEGIRLLPGADQPCP
jgi:hypothetical protein